MTTASWVIVALTFLTLGVFFTAVLRADAGKEPLPLAGMWAWSQMQLETGVQCARQLLKDGLRPANQPEIRLLLMGRFQRQTKGLSRSTVVEVSLRRWLELGWRSLRGSQASSI